MKFAEKVGEFICAKCAISPCGPILVALSGGADSVALLRVLLELGYDCSAAHCNFHLRGEESDRDERFVRELCAQLGVDLHVKHFDVPAYREAHGVSVEMACRELRYGWFNELLNNGKYKELAVAHHRDDNIETVFLNMLRGTGIAGLSGMKARNGAIVRPLLCATRDEVTDFLASLGQDFVTDSTNLSNDYQRNKVRNQVLLAFDDAFPQGRERIADTIRNVSDFQAAFVEMAERFWADGKCVSSGDAVTCDLLDLLGLSHPKLLLHHLLSKYGFNVEQCEQLIDGAKRQKTAEKAHFYSKTHTLTFDGQSIVIEKTANEFNSEYVVDFNSLESLPVSLDVSVHFSAFDPRCCDGKYVVAFDASLLRCGKAVLRRWRRGDWIRPFGMKGQSRLVSDIFSDAHLTLNQKKSAWLLEVNGDVVWILGMRASQDYNVTDNSESYILLKFRADEGR